VKNYIPLILGIVLLACGGGGAAMGYYSTVINANIHDFYTNNGVHCIWVSDGNAGGLSCDWK